MNDTLRRDLGGERLRVLLVEDQSDDARLTSVRLQASGTVSHCDVAGSLAELDKTRLEAADCALVDLTLPDASGLDVVHRVRELAPDLPVIVLTGFDDEALGVAALHSGAQDYLVKDRTDGSTLARAVRYAVERQRLQAQLAHQALHDPLTGLPNRALFLDRIEQTVADLSRRDGLAAVLYADLDHFKAINDSLGHLAGDELLVAVAGRLAASVRPSDTVARLGGDEFAVLCEHLTNPVEAERVAERVRRSLDSPFVLGGQTAHISISIGVTMAGRGREERTDAMELLREADAALYAAKEAGRDRIRWFDADQFAEAVERLTVLHDVRIAIEARELAVAYQPIIDLNEGRIVAFEALARWRHRQRGLLDPEDFLPAFEDPVLVHAIDRFVLHVALADLAHWRLTNPTLWVSVNVSEPTAASPTLADDVLSALAAHDLPGRALTLELLESAAVDPTAVEELARLRAAGVRVALDDFGAGASSLSHFLMLTADVLKLDRHLVHDALEERRPRLLLKLLLDAAEDSGMSVVAEGVETDATADMLRDLGVPLAQGYLWARPAVSVGGPPGLS